MRLPNKITPYNLSSLPLFVEILKTLEERDATPSELVSKFLKKSYNLNEILEALDLLFALGKIEFDENEMRINHVGRN